MTTTGVKVLWVVNKALDRALDAHYVPRVAGLLRARGLQVSIIARYIDHPPAETGSVTYLRTIGIPYLRQLSFLISLYLELARRIRSEPPDLVYVDRPLAFAAVASCIAIAARRRSRPRLVLDVRSISARESLLAAILVNLGLDIGLRYADAITCVSPVLQSEIVRRRRDRSTPPIMVWSSAVDEHAFDPERATRPSNWPFSSSRFTAIYQGSFSPGRRPSARPCAIRSRACDGAGFRRLSEPAQSMIPDCARSGNRGR